MDSHSRGTDPHEHDRLDAVARSGLLTSAADPTCDRAARTVARCLGVDVALVSVVGATEQHFVGQVGLARPLATSRRTPLSQAICREVAVRDDALVIEDAAVDAVVAALDPIVGLPVGAYVGVPLRDPDGVALGAVCAVTARPHHWSAADLASLEDVAAFLQAHLTLRATTRTMTAMVRDAARLAAARTAAASTPGTTAPTRCRPVPPHRRRA